MFNMDASDRATTSVVINNFLRNGECQCEWNRCLKKFPNFSQTCAEFWSEYIEKIRRRLDSEYNDPENVLYNVKTVCFCDWKLYLGLAPKHGFCVTICVSQPFDLKNVYLTIDQMIVLVDTVREIIDEVPVVNTDEDIYTEPPIHFIRIKLARMTDNQIKAALMCFTTFESMNDLIRMWTFIKEYIELLSNEEKECRELFTRILYAYATDPKNQPIYHKKTFRQFLISVSHLKCNCVPNKGFLLEMIMKWYNWMYMLLCVHGFEIEDC